MTTLTIPKALAKKGELVLIPRKEYEELLQRKKIRTFRPTQAEKRELEAARRDRAAGKYITLEELRHELARGGTR